MAAKRKYPALGEQLDMIYHDLKNGKDLRDGVWFNTILDIKAKTPTAVKEGKEPRPGRVPITGE